MSAIPHSVSPESGGHRERLLDAALVLLHDKGYAHTTARDLVTASNTNLKSIGYHFGGKEALLNEAIGRIFELWTTRVETVVFDSEPPRSAREALERTLSLLLDSFEEIRPLLVASVEAFAPAVRSEELRPSMAAAYARSRGAGADMVRRACARFGIDLPVPPETLTSVLIAITDGLMLQWLCDPANTPGSRQVSDVLAALSLVFGETP